MINIIAYGPQPSSGFCKFVKANLKSGETLLGSWIDNEDLHGTFNAQISKEFLQQVMTGLQFEGPSPSMDYQVAESSLIIASKIVFIGGPDGIFISHLFEFGLADSLSYILTEFLQNRIFVVKALLIC